MKWLICAFPILLTGCIGLPEGVTAVDQVDFSRYLGRWYEIARLDHSFERGLDRVYAEYAARDDGGVDVVNRGFDSKANKWKEARGVAYRIDNARPDLGRLKVSFFGPFYGAYNIIALDRENYSWAMVCGPDRSYLWILAREPTIDPALRDRLVNEARALGFPVDGLLFIQQ